MFVVHVTYFPNAELKVIKGAGHDVYSGKPDEIIAIIREYLNTTQQVVGSSRY